VADDLVCSIFDLSLSFENSLSKNRVTLFCLDLGDLDILFILKSPYYNIATNLL
jgi:hypothetical protein